LNTLLPEELEALVCVLVLVADVVVVLPFPPPVIVAVAAPPPSPVVIGDPPIWDASVARREVTTGWSAGSQIPADPEVGFMPTWPGSQQT
jgi:hypothetical protein